MAIDARGRADGEEAVSEVVGTVLMLGLTLTVFAGVTLAVLAYFDGDAAPPRATLQAERTGSGYLVVHQGGEPISLASGRVLVNVGGTEQEVDFADLAPLVDDGERWRIGESICLSGPASECYFGTQEVLGAIVVTRGAVLLVEGERGDPPPPPMPDLEVVSITAVPANPNPGDPVAFTVRVRNSGGLDAAGPFDARLLLDGSPIGSGTVAGPLAAGAEVDVAIPPWAATAGTHALLAEADPAGAVAESDEADNTLAGTVTVSNGSPDPGFPFEDVNGDALYTAGTDIALAVATVADGAHNAGVHGLVIPPSVGAISAGTVTFTAGNAAADRLVLGVAVTATTGKLTLASPGSIETGAVELKTLAANQDILATSCGSFAAAGTAFTSADQITLTCSGDIAFTAAATSSISNGKSTFLTSTNGAVTATGSTFTASGDVRVSGKLAVATTGSTMTTTGSGDTMLIRSTNAAVTASGMTITAGDKLNVEGGTSADFSGTTLAMNKNGATLTVKALGGALTVADSDLTVRGPATLTATGTLTATDLELASMVNGDKVTLQSSAGAVAAAGATLAGYGPMDILAASGLTLPGATLTLNTNGDALKLTTAAGTLDVSGAAAQVRGPPTLTGGSITATNLVLNSQRNNDKVTLTATAGGISAAGADIDSRGNIVLTAAGATVLDGARLDTYIGGDKIDIQTTAGSLSMRGIVVTTFGDATATAKTSLDFTGGRWTLNHNNDDLDFTAQGGHVDLTDGHLSVSGSITATVPTVPAATYHVTVTNAHLDDANDKANVPNPTSTYGVGTPAFGGLE